MNKYKVLVGNYALEFFFGVHISQQVALNAVRSALIHAAGQTYGTQNGGMNCDGFVSNLIKTYNGDLTLIPRYGNGTWTNQLSLTLESYSYKMYVYDGEGNKSVWNGSLNYFDAFKHVPTTASFSAYKDKTVRFTYLGGSTPNKKRIVKVLAYEDGCLKGTDLAKGEFRQFKTDKIKDIQEVKL